VADLGGLPRPLQLTAELLLRAYSTGLPEEDYLGLVAVLCEHMSHRNLAQSVSKAFDRDYDGVLNDIGKACSMAQHAPGEVARLEGKLNEAGLQAWIRESE
jgi:hypothetical protein